MPFRYKNPDDVDFDLWNIRAEEDWYKRMYREHNNWSFTCDEKRAIPINGDKIISEKVNNPKLTSTLSDFYNKIKTDKIKKPVVSQEKSHRVKIDEINIVDKEKEKILRKIRKQQKRMNRRNYKIKRYSIYR